MAAAEIDGRVMASRFHLIAVHETGSHAQQSADRAMTAAVRYAHHLERCWSRFLPASDISRINELGPRGGTVVVDPSTIVLLTAMVDGHDRTAGRFDPTVLRALIAEGYGSSLDDPTARSPIADAPARIGLLHELVIDAAHHTVSVPPGLVLDPGGIGKGLAADLVVARMLDDGVGGALVEIGGDLAMAGTAVTDAGWLVDVEHPDQALGVLCSLAISGGGIATSSVRSRRWTRDGLERHHQIDPARQACSTTDLSAVSVIAPNGWLAEVHATAALAVGGDEVLRYLDGHGLSGIAVSADGDRVWHTGDLDGVSFHVPCDAP
ncbi:MAG: FAD:protein FMN transferase [Ilumatobacteraceae bacterium]